MSSQTDISWEAIQLLRRFKALQAFVLASIQATRDYIEQVQERMEVEDEFISDRLENLLLDAKEWLVTAEQLRASFIDLARHVGIVVEKSRLGLIEDGIDAVRKLNQTLQSKRLEVVVSCIEQVGREVYRDALEMAEQLLSEGEDALEDSEEVQQLQEDINKIDTIIDDASDIAGIDQQETDHDFDHHSTDL